MLTWIDEWCDGMRFRRATQLQREGRELDSDCKSDGLAARRATSDAINDRNHYEKVLRTDCPHVIKFMSQLGWFLEEPSPSSPVRALQISEELADRLEDCEMLEAAMAFTRAVVDADVITYIDIPSGVVRLNDSVDLRAIFVEPVVMNDPTKALDDEEEELALSYCVVLAPAGKYGFRYAMWTDDRSQFVSDDYQHDDVEHENAPTFDVLRERTTWSQERFQDEVERLVRVTLRAASEDASIARERLPYMAPDNQRRRPGRGRQVAQRFSLFRIERLTVNRAEASENHCSGRNSWRLNVRILVRSHQRTFRDKKSGDIRIVDVKSYMKGPQDARPLHRLHRVHG
jgi:hypothetical protein